MSNIGADLFGSDPNTLPISPLRSAKCSYISYQSLDVGNGATVNFRTIYFMGYSTLGSIEDSDIIKESNHLPTSFVVVSYRAVAYTIHVDLYFGPAAPALSWMNQACAAGIPVFTRFNNIFGDSFRIRMQDTGAGVGVGYVLILCSE